MKRRRHSGISSRTPPARSVLPPTALAPWAQSSVNAWSIRPASPLRAHSRALSFVQDDEKRLIQDHLVDQEDSSEYIAHNLAAISTLHEKSTEPLLPNDGSNKLDFAAYQHHTTAASKFRQSVGTINDHNWFAVLIFAILVLIYHFDVHRRAKGGLSDDEFMEPILTLRVAAFLGMELRPWLDKSSVIAAVRRRVEAEKPPWDDVAVQAISQLQLINETSSPLRNRAVYRDTLNKLQLWMQLTWCKPRTTLHFIWWPGIINQEYLDLLARKDQMALVIFVHWCAVMRSSPKRWFMEGWAENVSRPAIPHIRQEWDGVMEWPLSRLGVAGSK